MEQPARAQAVGLAAVAADSLLVAARVLRDTGVEMLADTAHRDELNWHAREQDLLGDPDSAVMLTAAAEEHRQTGQSLMRFAWHQCPQHGRTTFTGPNAARWTEKMSNNKQRDRRAGVLAEEAGYRVLRLWDCVVVADPAAAAALVREGALAMR